MGPSAVVVIFDPEGNVLVLRRGPTAPWMPNRWNFPGGLLNRGESVQAAAYREVAEEAGFVLPKGSLRWRFSYRHAAGVTHLFTVRLAKRPEVTMPDGEHDAFLWTPLTRIPQPAIPHIHYVVDNLSQTPARSTRSALRTLDIDTPLGESSYGGFMHDSHSPPWPASWPGYLPFPYPIPRSKQPVPNEESVFWATAQFAPEWLPPGSPSFQPYRYPDGPMARLPYRTTHGQGDLRAFKGQKRSKWLYVQDPEALVVDTLQKLGHSSWLDDKTGRLMETLDPPCGCGPTQDCGCGPHARGNAGDAIRDAYFDEAGDLKIAPPLRPPSLFSWSTRSHPPS